MVSSPGPTDRSAPVPPVCLLASSSWSRAAPSLSFASGRREGILFLLSYMIEVAKLSGYTYITAIAENQHAINIYETLGFISDKGKSQTLILWEQ